VAIPGRDLIHGKRLGGGKKSFGLEPRKSWMEKGGEGRGGAQGYSVVMSAVRSEKAKKKKTKKQGLLIETRGGAPTSGKIVVHLIRWEKRCACAGRKKLN